jgi:hypothetical protein
VQRGERKYSFYFRKMTPTKQTMKTTVKLTGLSATNQKKGAT